MYLAGDVARGRLSAMRCVRSMRHTEKKLMKQERQKKRWRISSSQKTTDERIAADEEKAFGLHRICKFGIMSRFGIDTTLIKERTRIKLHT